MTDSPTRACPPASDHRRWSTRQPTQTSRPRRTGDTSRRLRTEQHPPARRERPGPTAAPRSASGRSWTPTPHWRLPIHRRRKQDQEHKTDPAPLTGPAPSGMTTRHRLNGSGDPRLSRALHTIALTRSRIDPATHDYLTRRVAGGKTIREAKRGLNRFIACQLFRLLQQPNPYPEPFDKT